MKYYYNLY